jgi:methylthioribose-1-phosphate isomerase
VSTSSARWVYNSFVGESAVKLSLHVAQPIEWRHCGVVVLDQRLLPDREVRNTYTDYQHVARAIRDMEIRGAPAIGVAAAMGLAIGVDRSPASTLEDLRSEFDVICDVFSKTRPTAVDLFWAISRMRQAFDAACKAAAGTGSPGRVLDDVRSAMIREAHLVHQEKREHDEAIGRHGAPLMPRSGRVMTQCNAGALATAGIGTALGVIRIAVQEGHELEVLVPETRPYLQGARLTAWELQKAGIPLKLITDNMVGHCLKTHDVGAIVVGADRIAANGDTANKIGTYQIAVLAREHGVPFFVAAPISTLDLSLPSGDAIPIEERPPEEVTHLRGVRIAPVDVPAAHFAFDVTPARFITAIITERGVARDPYTESLQKLAGK